MLSYSIRSIFKPSVVVRAFASAAFSLPTLPYARNALEPTISEATIKCHYDGHHQTYINNINNLTKDSPIKPLEHYITEVSGPIHNQAAQIWNHSFFWKCMTPTPVILGASPLLDAITKDFGSFASFQDTFSKTATAHFGSGWAWLVNDPKDNKLKVVNTSNEVNPMQQGLLPLLTLDVWEHAYYLDYQFRRADFIKNWWRIVNWNYVSEVYSGKSIPSVL